MISTAAVELRSNLAHIGGRIAHLQSQLALLQADAQNIREKLAAIVYPILTLPLEILSEIFLQYTGEYPTPGCNPMVPASVCSLWREVALSTPRLWTRFGSECHVALESVHISDLVRLWLSRAGSLPLDLRISLTDAGHRERPRIVDDLSEYSSQWGHLDLTRYRRQSVPNNCRYLPASLDAPRLTEIQCTQVSLEELHTSLPWAQITTLYFHDQIIDCLKLFEYTPNLEYFELTPGNYDLSRDITSPRRTLPRLHTLHLGQDRSHWIIPHLTLPALRVIHVENFVTADILEMQELVERSGCTPTSFYISTSSADDAGTIEGTLLALPSLEHLEIDCGENSRAGYEVLFGILVREPIVPVLRRLELVECTTPIEVPSLVQMLEARMGGRVQLESFNLAFTEQDAYEWGIHLNIKRALDTLRGLRDQGL
ncbi:hypothetical protein FB45DRAFT_1097194 [Roridomyces roridus]|uniref:F-box domain-containing protein n=1 Tax=Roridomyces roridus TaxID=1738132 RepID=A0AAD7BEL9_9AGAR|nr:hypothetical protein FB45DRAFT_1097194 [Roridomyces roridus]